ncbi:MAG: hypothetical protein K0Q60_3319 [Microvirga sp.]|nr:hypothetical protein [Microvirga sp.]
MLTRVISERARRAIWLWHTASPEVSRLHVDRIRDVDVARLPPESLTLVRTAAVLRLVSSAMRKRGGFLARSDPA